MKNITNHVVRFLHDETGPTAVEYAIMVSFIVIVCVGAITSVGTQLNPWFQATANVLR